MKLVEIVVSYAKKVNLGNYESKDVFASMKAFVETHDSLPEMLDALFAEVRAGVDRQIGLSLTERTRAVSEQARARVERSP